MVILNNMEMIVACDEMDGIGYKNKLLYDIKRDMQWFVENTRNTSVIMGRNTWESLPVKPLKNRTNIVISSSEVEGADFTFGCIQDIVDYVAGNPDKRFVVIGGESIYKQLEPYTSKLYLTRVHSVSMSDTSFHVDLTRWDLTWSEKYINTNGGPHCTFMIFNKLI